MNKDNLIVDTNEKVWNEHYFKSGRLEYPDTHYLSLLHRYALKHQPIKRALCIGAGDGPEAFTLAKLGIHVDCIDLAPQAVSRLATFIQEAGLTDKMQVVQGDQLDLSKFKDSSYDLVVSWSVLSYLTVKQVATALSEIRRVLRVGGSMIGLLESVESSGFYQPGAIQIEDTTFKMPSSSKTVRSDTIITFFTKDMTLKLLQGFNHLTISHCTNLLPPDCSEKVARWMFHAVK